MSQLLWATFIAKFPAAHLVTGAVAAGGIEELGQQRVLEPRHLMLRLIKQLNVTGFYAVSSNGIEVLAGFEKQIDAERLTAAVNAMPAGRRIGWSSHRYFILNRPAPWPKRSGLGGRPSPAGQGAFRELH